MLHGQVVTKIQDPGGIGLPGSLRGVLFGALILGAILWLAMMLPHMHEIRPWQAMLHAYFYFVMFGLGGMVFTCIQYCASAKWSIAVRRIAEGLGAFVPFGLGLFLLIACLGYGPLYHDRQVASHFDFENPSLKTLYISQPAIIVKGILFYGLWLFLIMKIRGNSLRQDQTKDKSLFGTNVKLSIAFLMLFAYTFSLHVVDLIQGLEPRWFSTMFGVYLFCGSFLSSMCVISLITIAMRKNRLVADAITKRQMYDLGTWIMAFSVFMVYISFSQYMLIWYANLPEETFYLITRTSRGWEYVAVIIPLLKWVVPFLVLMPQPFRSNTRIHIIVCIAVITGQWIDMFWLIYPSWNDAGPVMPGLAELGAFLFVGGLFGIVLDRVYRSHSVLPMGDPYLVMSVNGSYL